MTNLDITNILLTVAKRDGFDNYGICMLAERHLFCSNLLDTSEINKYMSDLYQFFLSQEDLAHERYGIYAAPPRAGSYWFLGRDEKHRIELLQRYFNHLKNTER